MQIGKWSPLFVGAALALAAAAPAWAQSDTIASVKQKGKIVVGVKADYKPFGYTDTAGKIVGLEIDLASDIAKRLGVQIELVPVIAANRMEFLKQGKIVVGVKADYKPFGYTDASGKIVGLEIDLASDIAKRLGVQIELVPVIAANRMEFLKQGKIDLMIATMAYRPDRAEVVGIPQPFYYAGAATVFAKKSSGLKTWADVKGKPICGIQGAYYNRKTGEEFGATMVVFKGVTEAMAALEGGNCVGTVFDTTYFAGLAGDPKWADYAMVLPAIDPEPWGMGVRKEDAKFAQYVSDVSKEWHKTGFILDLEKKWGIPQSPYLVEQQQKAK